MLWQRSRYRPIAESDLKSPPNVPLAAATDRHLAVDDPDIDTWQRHLDVTPGSDSWRALTRQEEDDEGGVGGKAMALRQLSRGRVQITECHPGYQTCTDELAAS